MLQLLSTSLVPCESHQKVYSGECLELGAGPRWYWICDTCLETGSDALGLDSRPTTVPRKYWCLMRQINPQCWVPASYR